MTIADSAHSAPDWSQPRDEEIVCPLCGYNLRGLVDPRCPECGFAFAWSELAEGRFLHHLYLFEHQDKRNVWSFWQTYWHDCRPRTFWKDLNPVQPVKFWRLILYWLLTNVVMLLLMTISLLKPILDLAQADLFRRRMQVGRVGPMFYNPLYNPQPWSSDFFSQVAYHLGNGGMGLGRARDGAILLMWPWLTLISLLVFQASMRRARIKTDHVLRAAIYGCDFGLLIMSVRTFLGDNSRHEEWTSVIIAGLCAIVATYRITFAYSRYMRFHQPFFTVLAAQFMAFLCMFILLVRYFVIF